jgi:hypothetical protein
MFMWIEIVSDGNRLTPTLGKIVEYLFNGYQYLSFQSYPSQWIKPWLVPNILLERTYIQR